MDGKTEYHEMRLNGDKLETVETYSMNQADLTADCWPVQFKGLNACYDCENFCKPDCGGGSTLLNILASAVIERTGRLNAEFSIMEQHFIAEHIQNGDEFHAILNSRNVWRLNKVYRKYVQYAHERHERESKAKNGAFKPLDELFPFFDMKEKGTIIEKGGYHRCLSCACELETRCGAYRDTVIEYDGMTFYYYHQHCIMFKRGNQVTLDSCGWKTITTKERLNKYLPSGWGIWQSNWIWYVGQYPYSKEKCTEFQDGMTLEL